MEINQNANLPELHYPETLPSEAFQEKYQHGSLDVTRMPCDIYFKDVNQLPNEQYALLRKDGFGGSDSSVLLGVNPYTTLNQLIAEKCRKQLTEEELAVGQQLAVRKGNDLEPLIIRKAAATLQKQVLKPSDMYIHKQYKYLRMNFDGVINDPEQYIPCEIKVVTARGEKHYTPAKAIYLEGIGWQFKDPPHYEQHSNSVETKAAQYGVPPYYYTQCQQEIMFAGAPYGYIATLFEKSWRLVMFKIWRDERCIKDIIIQGALAWEKVLLKRKQMETSTV